MPGHLSAPSAFMADDTTVPVLAKGKTDTARAWVYVRDDAPSGGADPPEALFYYSRDRSGAHPEKHLTGFTGILQCRCLCRVQQAVCAWPLSGAGHRGALLVPCAAQVLCPGRHRRRGEERGEEGQGGRHHLDAGLTAVAILNVGGGDDAVQQQALRIDQNMPLLALDQLAGIEAVAVDGSPPFSALFTL